MPSPYEAIDQQTVHRYSERYQSHGESCRTLGWGSREQQEHRFARVFASTPFAGRSVLDIGCGFADLLGALERANLTPSAYTGLDINPDFIARSAEKYPEARFLVASPLQVEPDQVSADVAVMLGLLNFKQSELDNWTYARTLVSKAFELCHEALVFDVLSTELTPDYPKEDFVFYYEPAKILELAFELTPFVSLHHDYRPIPQREMLVVMRKAPCA